MDLNWLLNLLFPSLCFGCGKQGAYLCLGCVRKKVKVVDQPICPICGLECYLDGGIHSSCLEYSYLDGFYTVCHKSSLAERVLSKGKYSFQYRVYLDLGKLLAVKSMEWRLPAESVVSFVPLSRYRANWRGFNQSYLLASQIARRRGFELRPLLSRRHNTLNQVGLTRENRLQNLNSTFICIAPEVDFVGKTILLVDDVYTTGATLQQAAKAIKQVNGSVKVIGITILRA